MVGSMSDKPKPIRFLPTEEDAVVFEALERRTGLRPPALIRWAIREKAIALEIWTPPVADSGAGDEDETTDEAATGTEG